MHLSAMVPHRATDAVTLEPVPGPLHRPPGQLRGDSVPRVARRAQSLLGPAERLVSTRSRPQTPPRGSRLGAAGRSVEPAWSGRVTARGLPSSRECSSGLCTLLATRTPGLSARPGPARPAESGLSDKSPRGPRSWEGDSQDRAGRAGRGTLAVCGGGHRGLEAPSVG